MRLPIQQPQIIVEEPEEDDDDVATPLRPTDTFPCKRRNSPFYKLTEENLQSLRVISESGLDSQVVAPSPTPSNVSTLSRHEFASFRLSDEVMNGMMHIKTICDQNKSCKTGKYVNTTSMTNYTVSEWLIEKEEDRQKITNSLDNLCQLRHRRLARTYGYHWKSSQLFIFRTHVPTGTIADKLKRAALPEDISIKYTFQTLDALNYLHDRRLVHGKLTCSNLLITISNDILLADPYIEHLPQTQKRRALLSSPPEAFRSYSDFPCRTPAADIWAVGCILVAMVTRFPPFSDHFLHFHGEKLHKEMIYEWKSNQLNFSSVTLTPTGGKELCELVDLIFVINPEARPTAQFLIDNLGPKSRKTSVRTSLTSIANRDTRSETLVEMPTTPMDHFYRGGTHENEAQNQLEDLIERHKKIEKTRNDEGVAAFLRWYLSRTIIFAILLIKWVGMVMCAALSLAMVAGSVFLSIFIIYNGIEVVCQCRLNEGFIVLIALILLPIIILLTTLCCNNSLEKYHNDVECGKVEKSRFVMRTPEKDVIICGYIVIEGKPREEIERKNGVAEGMAQLLNRKDFLSGVARIA